MLYGITKVVKYALGIDIAGRSLGVYPDDTFLVSYPRSGNTWMRFLIANLVHPHEVVGFSNIERLIPDCEAQSSRYMKRIPRPRFIKSHEYFDHRYKKVIYIVRDPRDVVLSYYNFQRKYRQVADDYPLPEYVSEFVAGHLTSADWGTWGQNVGSWLTCDGRSWFLLVRYEDMLTDPVRELERIARFLKIEPETAVLTRAVERSSVPRMRELEYSQGSGWVTTKNKRQDIPFIGMASAGGWKTRLPRESVVEIESVWGKLMERLDYALASCPAVPTGAEPPRSKTEAPA